MNPVPFKEANCVFGPPSDLSESQCMKIAAWKGQVLQGSVDGVDMVVVAWLPTPEELHLLAQGCPVYLTMIGGLAPHYLSTDFKTATNPA